MGITFDLVWQYGGLAGHLIAATASIMLGIWLFGRRERFGPAGLPIVVALGLTALWCLCVVGGGVVSPFAQITESGRNLAWLVVVYGLFSGDGRHTSVTPIRPVVFALGFVELLNLGIVGLMSRAEVSAQIGEIAFDVTSMFRLLVSVGGLMLVHNLYAGASPQSRSVLRWPATGLGVLWVFDLNLYTIAYLGSGWPMEIAASRGIAVIALACLIAIGASKGREELRLRPSRAVTFQTFSLLVIGTYFVAMVAISQWLAYAGGDFARLMELGFLTMASAVALLLLPSKRTRGWLKVILAKHFFQHRYDYREEWLRFTRTIGNSGAEASPLAERVVQAVADIAECPGGLLLAPGDHGSLTLAARWNWPEIDVPARAFELQALSTIESEGFIADLDDLRVHGALDENAVQVPEWLVDHPRAWALVPLIHYERLVGLVVLARPSIARKLDWEDFDLLRVVGQQLASYLAENASQDALTEASRFDDFHRRIAFVMHDIKNLASQLSLLARNAELHADKPAFRADMLVTLRNSAEKLNALIARLSRYGNGVVEKLGAVAASDVVDTVIQRFAGNAQVMLAQKADLTVRANRESLEQVLVHLIQNGLDASADGSPVFLSLTHDGLNARFEVVDSGSGMSPEFVRTQLFKPFVSTKQGGFGIGAFEARELVKAMRGRLEVESREGLGSRFIVRIPLAVSDETANIPQLADRKVAS